MDTMHEIPWKGDYFAARGGVWKALEDWLAVPGRGIVVRASRVAFLHLDEEEPEDSLCLPETLHLHEVESLLLDPRRAMARSLRQAAA